MFSQITRKWKSLREYYRMQREVEMLEAKVSLLKKDITNTLAANYCIEQKWDCVPAIVHVKDIFPSETSVFVKETVYCPNAFGDFGRFRLPCSKTSCPRCAANHAYVAALAEYKNALMNLRKSEKHNNCK